MHFCRFVRKVVRFYSHAQATHSSANIESTEYSTKTNWVFTRSDRRTDR